MNTIMEKCVFFHQNLLFDSCNVIFFEKKIIIFIRCIVLNKI